MKLKVIQPARKPKERLHLEPQLVSGLRCCLLPDLRSFLKKHAQRFSLRVSKVLRSDAQEYFMVLNLEPMICVDRSIRPKLTHQYPVRYG